MSRSREQVAAFLAEHVVDSAEAARMLGFAHRTGLAYHVRRGIEPIGRFGKYAARLAARRQERGRG